MKPDSRAGSRASERASQRTNERAGWQAAWHLPLRKDLPRAEFLCCLPPKANVHALGRSPDRNFSTRDISVSESAESERPISFSGEKSTLHYPGEGDSFIPFYGIPRTLFSLRNELRRSRVQKSMKLVNVSWNRIRSHDRFLGSF